MTIKAYELYQSGDRLTYRSTVAQAYETLDRMRELCEAHWADETPTHSDFMAAKPEASSESMLVVLSVLAGLCDDLASDVNALMAELIPSMTHDVTRHWKGFELHRQLEEVTQAIKEYQVSQSVSPSVLSTIDDTLETISLMISHLDQ